jgi:hypothetical protein
MAEQRILKEPTQAIADFNDEGKLQLDSGYVPKIGNRMGFIETIEDTLRAYRHVIDTGDGETFGFDEKLAMREVVQRLKISDLYYMGDEFTDMIKDYGDQFDDAEFNEIRLSEFTRPPSELCYIRLSEITRHVGVKNSGVLTQYFEDGVTSVMLAAPLTKPISIGGYHPKKGLMFQADQTNVKDWPEEKVNAYSNILISVAGAFELINNPRFVISEAAGTRTQRRQMKREQNIPLEAWHKISWNVDEDSVEIGDGDRGGWHMPLHYTRGHFRRGEPHWEDAVERNGIHYKWIEGFWSGHPAYGIKKGYHAPKLKAS